MINTYIINITIFLQYQVLSIQACVFIIPGVTYGPSCNFAAGLSPAQFTAPTLTLYFISF